MKTIHRVALAVLVVLAVGRGQPEPPDDGAPEVAILASPLRANLRFAKENGFAESLHRDGAIDTSSANPFFRSMGQNGRSCGTCGAPIPGTCDEAVARIQTTDPGAALITGKWGHLATFEGPILRAPSGRAPYFHDGSAASLEAVVDLYDDRFGIGLSAGERADLTAFLSAL